MIKRSLVRLLIVLLSAHSPVLAQAQKAGVVTTLEGNVSARRVALPSPVPLKFKDDVFLQDTVTTGDKSLARMLLGGKAVVTVRERSVLTITEVPGRTSIDLDSGKFALAVAREKMRPDEEIQIRTPNAVAGVRGTVVITEVERQGAQVGAAVPAVVTNFFVLRGEITAQQLDAARNPFGAPFQVGTMQSFSAAGLATPRVQPVQPGQIARITSGLQPTGRKAGGDAGKEQVKTQQQQAAVALLGALAGGSQLGGGSSTLAFQSYTTGYGGSSIVNPVDPLTGECLEGSCNLESFLLESFNVPDFDTDLTSDSLLPFFQFSNQSVTKSTSFFKVGKAGKVKLAGPLSSFVNSAVLTGGSLLDTSGSLTSTGTTALIALDPSFIGAAQNVVTLDGGTLTLAGPLITDTSGIIVSFQEFLKMINNASLTSTGSGALIQLDGTSVSATAALNMTSSKMTLAGPLVTATNVGSVDSSVIAATLQALGLTSLSIGPAAPTFLLSSSTLTSTGTGALIQLNESDFDQSLDFIRLENGSTMTLAGPLLTLTSSDIDSGRSFLVIHDSAVVKDTSSEPFISLTDSTVTSLGSFLSLRRSGATPSTLELAGPFLVTSGGSLTFESTVLLDQNGLPRLCCSLFAVGQGAVLTGTTTSPLISLAGTSLNVGDKVLVFFDTTSIFGEPTITAAATATLKGPLFKATGSTSVSGLTDVLGIFRSSVSSTTTEPFLDLNGTSVSMGATSPIDGSTTAGRFVNISANSTTPSSLALRGPLLNATNSTISTTDDVFGIFNGATLSSTTASPLVSISGGSVATGQIGQFFAMASGSGLPGTALTLVGPFLLATGTTLSIGDPTKNLSTLLSIHDGSQVSSTSTSPFMSLTNNSIDVAGGILSLRRSTSTTPTRLTLAGPLLSATNSTFNHTALGFGTTFGTTPSACCDMFFIGQGAQLSSTTASALVQLTGSTVIGADAQSGGSLFGVADTFTGVPATEVVAPVSVTLDGPLLQSTNSNITELFNLIRVQRSSLTSTSGSPLIDISGGSVILGGTDPTTGSSAIGNLLFINASSTSGTPSPSPASVTLAGPLARFTNATFNSGAGNVVSIRNGAAFTGSGTGALFQLSGSSLTGFNLVSLFGLGGTTGSTLSSMTTAGPMLDATNSTITLGSNVIFQSGTFTSTTTAPLIQISGTALTAGTAFSGADVLQVNSGTVVGTPPGTSVTTLNGPVFQANSGSQLTIPGALLGAFGGARLVVNGSTSPLFQFTGGTHSFGTAVGDDRDTALSLLANSNGFAAPTSFDVDSGLTLGTFEPLQHGGVLIEANGATLTTNKLVRLDTALLQASAPLLNLKGSSNVTITTDAIDLTGFAKLNSPVSTPLVKIDASTMNILNGSAVRVANGSFLNVAGDLFSIVNPGLGTVGKLNITNGGAIFASGSSVVNITGALVNFGTVGGGNQLNITNTLCTSCSTIGGLTVEFRGGASPSSGLVNITSPITNGSNGSVNLSSPGTSPGNTAVIIVDGASTKLTIGSGF